MDAMATPLLLLLLPCLAVPVMSTDVGKARSCAEVRQFYSGKGFTLQGVPQSEISGEHLRVCVQGYTCCTSAMEATLVSLGRREMEGVVREAGRSVQATLNAQYRSFDTYFLELLDGSERWLESEFSSLGALYERNAGVFREFYAELRRFYRGSPVSLTEALERLWNALTERQLKAAPPGDNENITAATSEDFLDCSLKEAEISQLLGPSPHSLQTPLVRTLLSARAFAQGLTTAGEVIRKVSQVPLSDSCNDALMKLMYCGQCHGVGGLKPCATFCSNVMRGCLANQADLQPEWDTLIATLVQVASSFGGRPSLDEVLYSIPVAISEALRHQQDNMETFTQKVQQVCGTEVTVEPTESQSESSRRKRGVSVLEYKTSSTAAVRLEVQVSDVSSKLKEMQNFWPHLLGSLCKSRAASTNDRCWNGMGKARYQPELVGAGLANQNNNPEVEVDITRPDMTIRQQIMTLKITTARLLTALSGHDVDYMDTSDEMSGSGGGLCLDPPCVHSRVPVSRYYPTEIKRAKGTANQITARHTLLLLPLACLLLRRD
ncbi:glypican-1 [Engraulis encrasicolus]|uniref:glypican-1 n=1 Tax=Engraulis encrasicolus TaxID=184585 RepID=UPI002FD7120D